MLQKATTLFFFLLLLIVKPVSGQFIINGDFSSGTSSWGCGVEVNTESTYGGSSSNAVVEVDAGAGLCQTITGLTIGNTYQVSFSASRRTGGCASPAITNIDVTVSGGALFTTITRTNTTFGFTSDYFLFTANSTNHTVNFAAGAGFGGSTCGMIMDNFAVSFSPLPIELLDFKGFYRAKEVAFEWATATEKNNAYFILEKSENGIDFNAFETVSSKAPSGNSSIRLAYTGKDRSPGNKLIYYRLKQVDYDGTFSFSKLISIDPSSEKENKLYPNPNNGEFIIESKLSGTVTVKIMDSFERLIHSEILVVEPGSPGIKINLKEKPSPGFYQCLLQAADTKVYLPLILH